MMPSRRVIVPGEASVTKGIISAFRYSTRRDAQLVQNDASINPGNSGGPLFTPQGQIVGLQHLLAGDYSDDGSRPCRTSHLRCWRPLSRRGSGCGLATRPIVSAL